MPLPLDLRLLWYFKRTAEIGSLTKAAAELGTSQPTLTRHIMRLEHELRAPLLLRDQRGVTPTEVGALVLDKAEALLRLEQAMKDDIGMLSRTIAGDVALCMPSSMHWIITLPMTIVVAAKFPDIRLRLMDGFDHLSRAQLLDDEEQARECREVGAVEVLLALPQAHKPQGNQVRGTVVYRIT